MVMPIALEIGAEPTLIRFTANAVACTYEHVPIIICDNVLCVAYLQSKFCATVEYLSMGYDIKLAAPVISMKFGKSFHAPVQFSYDSRTHM